MKTSELQGAALDWAVARCMDLPVFVARGGWLIFDSDAYPEFRNDYDDAEMQSFRPSTDWAQGGAIIEREKIEVFIEDEGWKAYSSNSLPKNFDGETPLIAAMRCYVASKVGDEIEIPEELK